MELPVLFLTYKRFDTAIRVFEVIKKIKPRKLYFASNAPNPENKNESRMVKKVRNIVNTIDWECKVMTLYRDKHLSVKDSIPSSIDWFFKNEDKGIILEDDCLPDVSFFQFCDEMLKKFEHDSRVMMISGTNMQDGIKRGVSSYYFSRQIHIWGWATWADRWEAYDKKMLDWEKQKKEKFLSKVFDSFIPQLYWTEIFNRVYAGNIKTWDYQWNYTCWLKNGLSCIPNVNLISNIGFGVDSTFTKDPNANEANLSLGKMNFPLIHNSKVEPDKEADEYTFKKYYLPTYKNILIYIFKKFINLIIGAKK